MPEAREYKYVTLPTSGKEIRSDNVAAFASDELNQIVDEGGWEVINVARPQVIGPIGFLLVRDKQAAR